MSQQQPSEEKKPETNPSSSSTAVITTPPKKIPPIPWTHLETVNLIEVYRNKWYSLKRGQLKASQWEEVANTIASNCGFDEPSKSSNQCRHKMEKLRKRYRSEKQRPFASNWVYFDLMDQMEHGIIPISVKPISSIPPQDPSQNQSTDEEDEVDDDDERFDNVRSRSINHILRRPQIVSRVVDKRRSNHSYPQQPTPVTQNWKTPSRPMERKRKSFEIEEEEVMEEEEPEEEEENGGGGGGGGLGGRGGELLMELASVIRKFGEGFVKFENRKIEMMREMERNRMEMEAKRIEMIINSQNRIIDTINKAFASRKKVKEEAP